METDLKSFVSTSTNDRKVYQDYLTYYMKNSADMELLTDENNVSYLDHFRGRQKTDDYDFSSPGSNTNYSMFFGKIAEINSDITKAVNNSKDQIAKHTDTEILDDGSMISSANETLTDQRWIEAMGNEFDLMTSNPNIKSSYDRAYKRALKNGETEASSSREWWLEMSMEKKPALQTKTVTKNVKLDEPGNILKSNIEKRIATNRIGSRQLKFKTDWTEDLAKQEYELFNKSQKTSLRNSGINDSTDYYNYIKTERDAVDLTATAKDADKESYNVITSNSNVYDSGGRLTVNFNKARSLGLMSIPILIDESLQTQEGQTYSVLPVNMQVSEDGKTIGMNIKMSSEDKSANLVQLQTEQKTLESSYKESLKKLKDAGYDENKDSIDKNGQSAKKKYGYVSSTRLSEIDSDLKTVREYKSKLETIIEEQNKIESGHTTPGFMPIYNIESGDYTNNYDAMSSLKTGIDRAIKSILDNEKTKTSGNKKPKHNIN